VAFRGGAAAKRRRAVTSDERQFKGFVGALMEESTPPVSLVVDKQKVHHATCLEKWFKKMKRRIGIPGCRNIRRIPSLSSRCRRRFSAVCATAPVSSAGIASSAATALTLQFRYSSGLYSGAYAGR
jgi:hypothetical protein